MANTLLQDRQDRVARIEQLSKRKEVLVGEADIIHKAVAAATPARGMTKEERTQFEEKISEIENINETLKLEERMTNAYSDSPKGKVEVHDNWTDKPNLFGYEAKPGETEKQRSLRLAIGFGEQLQKVKEAAIIQSSGAGGVVDPRLFELQRRAVAAGSSEAVPADGGFLIAPDFSSEVLMIAHQTGQVFTRTRKLPISQATNILRIPGIDEQSRVDGSRFGGVLMRWENESDALVGSKPKFRIIDLVTKKLTGLYYSTNELLADAAALGAIITMAFGQEMGFKMDDATIRGTGAGEPQGFLNSASLVTVAKESGQAATSLVLANVRKMWARMWPSSRPNSVWLINTDVEAVLYDLVIQGTNSGVYPVYLPPGGISGLPYGTLLGRPVIVIEQADTLGTLGDITLVDLSQMIMVDKGDMQSAVSMHVQFLTDQMTYRWIYRVDLQSQWHTALTPFKGTNTLSPFVALASRT